MQFNQTLTDLMQTFPRPGELLWIGIRPARQAPLLSLSEVSASMSSGLIGDHYAGRSAKRQVTLLQWEHLAVLSALTGMPVSAELLRRNLVVRGINLLACKNQQLQIGTVILQYTGLCQPCSRMETVLGRGGYNAMRGHGGINAQVVQDGVMRVGDPVQVLPQAQRV